MSGEMVDFYIWAQFEANAARYAVRTNAEIFVNNVFEEEINLCSFETIPVGTTDSRLAGPISVDCEDIISVQNIWIGWETSAATCADASVCKDYPPSKCNLNIIDGGIVPVNTNFSFDCGPSSLEICFTDLTTGGNGTYTYDWNFGDGSFSTLKDPCHVYEAGTHTVILKVADSDGNETSKTIDVNSADCFIEDLPVELIDFGVRMNESRAIFTWRTAGEVNNSHFIIQLIEIGGEWSDIGRVDGAGTVNEVQSYVYNYHVKKEGKYLARLIQVDLDGKYEYSSIITLESKTKSTRRSIIYYPNPVSNQLSYEVNQKNTGQSLQIVNLGGQAVIQFDADRTGFVDTTPLRSGVYAVLLIDSSGNIVDQQRLVKVDE